MLRWRLRALHCGRRTERKGDSGRREAVLRAVVRMAVALRHTDLPALRNRQACTVSRCRADYWKRADVGTILTRDYPQRGKPARAAGPTALRKTATEPGSPGAMPAVTGIPGPHPRTHMASTAAPSCTARIPLTPLWVTPLENCGHRARFASFAAPETRRPSAVQRDPTGVSAAVASRTDHKRGIQS